MSRPNLGVIVLAGGQGTRMGGVDKASVRLDGTRLVDLVLSGLEPFHPDAVTVVSPREVALPDGVARVSEDPPYGGPVAGIDAGAKSLDGHRFIAVLSVDAPASPRALGPLAQALSDAPEADVAVVRAGDGVLQPLCALWRGSSLLAALSTYESVRDHSAKSLLKATTQVVEIDAAGTAADYDTVAELSELGEVSLPED